MMIRKTLWLWPAMIALGAMLALGAAPAMAQVGVGPRETRGERRVADRSADRSAEQSAENALPSHAGQTDAPVGVAGGAHDEEHQVIEFDANTAVWVVLIFLILLAVLYPTAWKGVLAGLKAREERIRKDIADAEAARDRANATLAQYNKQMADAENRVRELIASATVEGEKVAASIQARAREDGEEIKERANREIETARQQAVKDIYDKAAELSTAIAEKILRRNLNADDQRDLVNAGLDEIQKLNRA